MAVAGALPGTGAAPEKCLVKLPSFSKLGQHLLRLNTGLLLQEVLPAGPWDRLSLFPYSSASVLLGHSPGDSAPHGLAFN